MYRVAGIIDDDWEISYDISEDIKYEVITRDRVFLWKGNLVIVKWEEMTINRTVLENILNKKNGIKVSLFGMLILNRGLKI